MEAVIIRNIFENLSAGLLVINPQGKIVLANAAASAILGYPVETIAGNGWADLFLGGEIFDHASAAAESFQDTGKDTEK